MQWYILLAIYVQGSSPKKKEKENTIHVQVICTLAEYPFFLVQFNTR